MIYSRSRQPTAVVAMTDSSRTEWEKEEDGRREEKESRKKKIKKKYIFNLIIKILEKNIFLI